MIQGVNDEVEPKVASIFDRRNEELAPWEQIHIEDFIVRQQQPATDNLRVFSPKVVIDCYCLNNQLLYLMIGGWV